MTCMSCKLGYPINPKRVVAFCKISPLKCGQDKKMTDVGYKGLRGLRGLQEVTGGFRALQEVTRSYRLYMGLQGVTRSTPVN